MAGQPKTGRVRLSDIAKEAGVSTSLVSRILNNNMGNVSANEEIILRVRAIAKAMHYVPDRRARGLKTGKNLTIAVMLPLAQNFTTSVYPSVLHGIATGCKDSGYDLVFQHYFGAQDEVRGLRAIRRMNIDGLIYAPDPAQPMDEKIITMLQEMLDCGIHIVFCMEKYEIPGTYAYCVDDKLGMELAAGYLLARGHRDILHVHYLIEQRRETLLSAAREGNARVTLLPCDGFLETSGYAAMRAYLEQGNEPPPAIVAVCDVVAIGVLQAMQERGLDLSRYDVVGYDYLAFMKLLPYPFASIEQPTYEVGLLAAHNMLALLDGKPVSSRLLEPTLIQPSA